MDPRLTKPDDPALARFIADTHPSMAHWAGSGPDGKTCRECAHWSSGCGYKRDHAGELLNRRCRKYTRLNQGVHGGVPHDAKACKYYAGADSPPLAIGGRKAPKAA